MEIILKFFLWLMLIAIFLFECAQVRYYFKIPKGVKSINILEGIRKIALIKETKINSRKVFTITSKENDEKAPTILYIHGGAYVGGISNRHWNFIMHIVKDTKAKIIFPDYPLAPKRTYKDVFSMITTLYEKLDDVDNLVVLGDSAGGAITLALMETMSIECKKLPRKIILISPWLDITLKNKLIDEVQKEDKVLNKQVLKLASEMYCGKDNPDNYLTSPINGPIDKLENLVIFSGTNDILNPDVHVFEKRFEDMPDILKIYERNGASHNWIIDNIVEKNEDYKSLISEIMK